jgi:hypothetical protein
MKVLKNNLAKNDIFVISGYGTFIFIGPSKYGLIQPGQYVAKQSKNLAAVVWMDNRHVSALSTNESLEQVKQMF